MKIISDKTIQTRSFRLRLIRYGVTLLILTFLHLIFLRFIEIYDITPDLLLILCVWISITEGQFIGILAAFAIGIFFDIFSIDVIGTNALAKTIAAFIAGWFFIEEKSDQTIKSYKFPLAVFTCALANNVIYYLFHIDLSGSNIFELFLLYGVAGAAYTTFFSVFAILMKLPRKKFKLLK